MRGEPHVGLDRHMSWISSRTSLAMAGRPSCVLVTQPSPVLSKPFLLPGDDRAGLDEQQGMLPAGP